MEFINNRAKSKTNGVYSIRGIVYRVRDNRATHYCYNGEVFEDFGNFVVVVGRFRYSDGARKLLKDIKI